MRFGDLIRSSLASLWQRKFRTSLTVLGVVIGTMAVVVMVSLGVGMSQAQLDSIEKYSSLRQIDVYGPPVREDDPGAEPAKMDATFTDQLAALPGVENVWPVYRAQAELRVAGFTSWAEVTGVPHSMLESLDVEFAHGELPPEHAPLAFVMGDKVSDAYFWDEMTGMPADIDFRTEQVFVTFLDEGGMDQPVPPGGDGGEQPGATKPPQRFLVPTAAVIAGEEMDWGPHSMAIYADLEALVGSLEKAFPGKALPGQEARSDGRPAGPLVYSQFIIETTDVAAAEELTVLMQEAGYSFNSSIEWMRQIQEQSALIQAVFGGIGLISLLVAAIGIANTMLMSVYERTREIGIMKVLGAALKDIRRMFLLESACIGFLGGIAGLLLSLTVSAVINATLGAGGGMFGEGTQISLIPVWLMVGAVGFSTLVGTVAGMIPATRAMRLSALGAIRAQ